MSEQSKTNPTTTVQVNEVGLPEQASVGKILLVAGAAAGAAATLIALLTEKEETPPTKTESARQYLQNALEDAQQKDFAKITRKQRNKAEKNLKKQQAKASKEAEKLARRGKQVASDSANAVNKEVSSLLDSIKSGAVELDKVVEGFAESQLMSKIREFGEEAKVIADQGKMKSEEAAHKIQGEFIPKAKKAADDAAHKIQDDVMPQARKAADEAAHKFQDEVVPQARKAAEEARKAGKEKLDEVADRAKNEFIPEAQKHAAEFTGHAQETLHQVGEDAEKAFSEAAERAEKKSKQAAEAVKRGGRETRSLLMWVSLAGILIFTVFLDEEQRERIKEVGLEIFRESRDMYNDMKGDTSA